MKNWKQILGSLPKWLMIIFAAYWMIIFLLTGLFGDSMGDLISLSAGLAYYETWVMLFFGPIAIVISRLSLPQKNIAKLRNAKPMETAIKVSPVVRVIDRTSSKGGEVST